MSTFTPSAASLRAFQYALANNQYTMSERDMTAFRFLNETLGLDADILNDGPVRSIFKFMTKAQRIAYRAADYTNNINQVVLDAIASGYHIFFPPGRGMVTGTGFQLKPGQRVESVTAAPYVNDIKLTGGLINNDVGGGIFKYTGDTSTGTVGSPQIVNMRLRADFPIVLNDLTTTIDDAVEMPYLCRPLIRGNYISARAVGVGRAITATKIFNGRTEDNTIESYSTGILYHACDINKITNNRVQGCTTYSIQLQTADTFGSQNEVSGNDLLSEGSPNLVHIKGNDFHLRLFNNYLENSAKNGPIKGFIDIGNEDPTTFGENTANNNRSNYVVENRIDGMDRATDYIYRLKAPSLITVIHDSLTSGALGSAPILKVVGDYLPMVYSNLSAPALYDFKFDHRAGKFANFNTFDDFDPITTSLTPRNYSRAFGNDLQSNNAHQHILTDGESFVLLPTLNTTNVADGGYMRFLGSADGINNPWFEQYGLYEMLIRARTDDVNGDALAIGMYNGSVLLGSSAISSLKTQFSDFTRNFAGSAAGTRVGPRIASGITATGKRFIKSIKFNRKHHARQIVGLLSAGNADAAVTGTTSATLIQFAVPLTADRAVTFDTTLMYVGQRFRVERTSAATGAFGLDVGGLINLMVGGATGGQWAELEYTTEGLVLVAFGCDTGTARGDSDVTFTSTTGGLQSLRTPLTANRTVSFTTANMKVRQFFILERLAETGAFTWNIGGLTTVAAGETAIVMFDGTAMVLVWKGRM